MLSRSSKIHEPDYGRRRILYKHLKHPTTSKMLKFPSSNPFFSVLPGKENAECCKLTILKEICLQQQVLLNSSHLFLFRFLSLIVDWCLSSVVQGLQMNGTFGPLTAKSSRTWEYRNFNHFTEVSVIETNSFPKVPNDFRTEFKFQQFHSLHSTLNFSSKNNQQ